MNKDVIIDYINIFIGVTILSLSVIVLFKPSGIVIGGVSGISILLESITYQTFGKGVPIWLTNTIINIPLFIIGKKVIGKAFFLRSLFGFTVGTTVFYYIGMIEILPVDEFLITIIGGAGVGVGVAFANKSGGSSGGTDLLAAIIKKFHPHLPVNKILTYIDGTIILFGMYIFGIEKGLYALIAAYIVGKTFGIVLEGLTFARIIYIITNKPDELSSALMKKLNRGVTGLQGRGMYTKQEKVVLFTVIAPRQIGILKDITEEIDENAFIIVSDAKEVLGYGFDRKMLK